MVAVIQPRPVVLGGNVTLMCNATGDMPITYTWEMVWKEGTTLNTDTSTGQFTLTVMNAADYGMYTCTATNILGSDSGTVDVIPASELKSNIESGGLYHQLEPNTGNSQ